MRVLVQPVSHHGRRHHSMHRTNTKPEECLWFGFRHSYRVQWTSFGGQYGQYCPGEGFHATVVQSMQNPRGICGKWHTFCPVGANISSHWTPTLIMPTNFNRDGWRSSWKKSRCIGPRSSPKSKRFKSNTNTLSPTSRSTKHRWRRFSCSSPIRRGNSRTMMWP